MTHYAHSAAYYTIWVGSGNETIKSLTLLLKAHCFGSNSASAYYQLTDGTLSFIVLKK